MGSGSELHNIKGAQTYYLGILIKSIGFFNLLMLNPKKKGGFPTGPFVYYMVVGTAGFEPATSTVSG